MGRYVDGTVDIEIIGTTLTASWPERLWKIISLFPRFTSTKRSLPNRPRWQRFVSRLNWIAFGVLACTLPAQQLSAQAPPSPIDMSPEAVAARAAFYSVPGREKLSGEDSPLKPGTRIDFFGDSITWLNGYVQNIRTAINTGPGTTGQGIVLINRGVDGAGVVQIRDGEQSTRGFGGVRPLPFATTIANDHADVAVVFIGVNDVWWRGTSPVTFQQGLEDIVAQGQAAGVTMVLATLLGNGEKPDGTNLNDPIYDQFAQITRDVAAATDTTLVDLRKAFIYYNMNNNPWQLVRNRYTFQSSGILTYDAVHTNATGNLLLADMIADGIYRSLIPEPVSLTLFALGALFLPRRGRPRFDLLRATI